MPGELIDGKKLADEVRADLKPRLASLADRGLVPGLAAIIVGEDPGSKLYVKMKGKASEEMGLAHWTVELPESVSERRLVDEIDRLNADPKVHGILVQQPLPPQIRVDAAVSAVDPRKDVDCFHPTNVGLVLIGRPRFAPATPAGVGELLLRPGDDPGGKGGGIAGRSNNVGEP